VGSSGSTIPQLRLPLPNAIMTKLVCRQSRSNGCAAFEQPSRPSRAPRPQSRGNPPVFRHRAEALGRLRSPRTWPVAGLAGHRILFPFWTALLPKTPEYLGALTREGEEGASSEHSTRRGRHVGIGGRHERARGGRLEGGEQTRACGTASSDLLSLHFAYLLPATNIAAFNSCQAIHESMFVLCWYKAGACGVEPTL